MRYAVIDPANKAGVALVEDGKLKHTCVLRKMGASGKWIQEALNGSRKFDTQFDAFYGMPLDKRIPRCAAEAPDLPTS